MEEGVERRGGRGGGGGGEVLHCSVGVAREKQWGHHRENPEPAGGGEEGREKRRCYIISSNWDTRRKR